MKNRRSDNIKTILLTVVILLLTRIIGSLPWWSFVVPVTIFGVVITIKKWEVSGFAAGFAAGFLTWLGANLFFDLSSNGIVLTRIGLLISVPKIVVLLISGMIGGLLTGLALHTGQSIVAEEQVEPDF